MNEAIARDQTVWAPSQRAEAPLKFLRVFARDYITTKNAKSTKEEKLHVEIFFFESNNPFFVAFVRFVVKSI